MFGIGFRKHYVAMLGVAALALPGAAHAADGYSVDFCKNWATDAPGNVFPGLTSFGAYGEVADCYLGGVDGGLHQLQLGGRMGYDTVAGIQLAVPADRPAISIDRVLTAHSLQANTGSAAFLRFTGGGTLLDNVAGAQVRRDDRLLPAGTRTLEWSVYCSYSAGATPCQWPTANDVLHLYKARLFLSEYQAPTLSVTGGTLLSRGPQSGVRSVIFDANDANSGLASATVMLGDVPVAVKQYACSGSDWSACERTRSGQTVVVDTTQVPDGVYQVNVSVRDAANNAASHSAGEVSIVNGHSESAPAPAKVDVPALPPLVSVGAPNGAPASRKAVMSVGYAGARSGDRTARVTYASALLVRGRLVDEKARPISRAVIAVLSRHRRAGAPVAEIARLTTNAEGEFEYRLAGGPSRVVRFAYTAFGGEASSVQASVTTTVRASIAETRFMPRAPRPGERVRFVGKLRYLPRGGVQIAIQFRDGRRWRTIGLTRTGHEGRFTWIYRFVRSRPGDVFEFRAHVSSPIYPFAAGSSPAVQVQLRR